MCADALQVPRWSPGFPSVVDVGTIVPMLQMRRLRATVGGEAPCPRLGSQEVAECSSHQFRSWHREAEARRENPPEPSPAGGELLGPTRTPEESLAGLLLLAKCWPQGRAAGVGGLALPPTAHGTWGLDRTRLFPLAWRWGSLDKPALPGEPLLHFVRVGKGSS